MRDVHEPKDFRMQNSFSFRTANIQLCFNMKEGKPNGRKGEGIIRKEVGGLGGRKKGFERNGEGIWAKGGCGLV